ncbi:hypothetical protein Ocin01_00369 [Orchesella cincta]|uniref:Uncharacterized protein n=1 Tax=Orchesella cincta TaxID=48709 RepID=A0A1D2NM29_ORCCI|nr:hypothetical protein Ocin01_00369 [Orchesella cincta]
MSVTEIPKHVRFISTIFDYPVSLTSPSRPYKAVWGTMRIGFIQKFKTNGTQWVDEPRVGMPRSITTLEKRLIQDCVINFYLRVKTRKKCCDTRKGDGNPLVHIFGTSNMFMDCFNSYLSRFDGLYLEKYGIISAKELRIENGEFLSQLLQNAVDFDFLPKKVCRVANDYLSIMKAKQKQGMVKNNNSGDLYAIMSTDHK